MARRLLQKAQNTTPGLHMTVHTNVCKCLSVTRQCAPSTPLVVASIDLAQVLGSRSAFVGFTGGSQSDNSWGGRRQHQTIYSLSVQTGMSADFAHMAYLSCRHSLGGQHCNRKHQYMYNVILGVSPLKTCVAFSCLRQCIICNVSFTPAEHSTLCSFAC